MTERVLGPSGSKRRKTRLLAIAALVAAGFAVFFVVGAAADQAGGCDFSPANNGTASCNGPLTGSTFAGGDGNLVASPTNFGTTDWSNVAGLNKGIDLVSGTTDNSFGQGSKTDDPNVTVVTGSIPPNKSDLIRFYEASEVGSNLHNFLYLAWERTNVLGSANFNFEINKKTQPNLTTPGAKTLDRSAGDLLVTYDFTNGGGRPTIGLLRWLTSATVPVVPDFATNVCFSANSFPCWGDKVTLDGTDSIAAVNNLGPVTDPIPPDASRTLPALTFGETAIDLTTAGVFPAGTCSAFGSAMVTSRSSASFTSEIKDFIAPIGVNISNCGTINIIKHTDPRGIDENFSYTSTIPAASECTNDTTPAGFTLNDKAGSDPTSPITAGTDNTEHCANVPGGSYTVTEGAEPANFTLESLSCTVDGSGGSTGSQHEAGSPQADITLAPGDTVTCTYTNKQQLGAIKIMKKTSKAAGTAVAGAHFRICTDGTDGGAFVSCTAAATGSDDLSSGSNTYVCVDNLSYGDYYVSEKTAPSGYAIDDLTVHKVTVNNNAKCSDSTFVGETYTFFDTPLTDLLIKAKSEATGGTKSSIKCVDTDPANFATGTDIGNSPQPASGFADPAQVDANGTTTPSTALMPGTYTCKVVIDP